MENYQRGSTLQGQPQQGFSVQSNSNNTAPLYPDLQAPAFSGGVPSNSSSAAKDSYNPFGQPILPPIIPVDSNSTNSNNLQYGFAPTSNGWDPAQQQMLMQQQQMQQFMQQQMMMQQGMIPTQQQGMIPTQISMQQQGMIPGQQQGGFSSIPPTVVAPNGFAPQGQPQMYPGSGYVAVMTPQGMVMTQQNMYPGLDVNAGYPGAIGNSSQVQPTFLVGPNPQINTGYPGSMGNSSQNPGDLSGSGRYTSQVLPGAATISTVQQTTTTANTITQKRPLTLSTNVLLQTPCFALNGPVPLFGRGNVFSTHWNFVSSQQKKVIVVTIPFDTITEIKADTYKNKKALRLYTNDGKVHTFFDFKKDGFQKSYDLITKHHFQCQTPS